MHRQSSSNEHSLSSQASSRCVSWKYVQLKRYSADKVSLFNWQKHHFGVDYFCRCRKCCCHHPRILPVFHNFILEDGTCGSTIAEQWAGYKPAPITSVFSFLWANKTLHFFDSLNGQIEWDALGKAASGSVARADWDDGYSTKTSKQNPCSPFPWRSLCAIVQLQGFWGL